MEANQVTPTPAASRTHPLLLAAAASVTILSLAGAATLAGWLPGPGAGNADPAKLALASPQITPAAPVAIQPPAPVPQEKASSVTRPSKRESVSTRRAAPVTESPAVAVSRAPTFAASTPAPVCHECGVVEAVREVAVEPKGSGGGAVAGGVVGGIIGNQIGKGATRDIATVLGAVGGAYAGNHIEKSTKESKRYDVIVRFEDGSTRTFSSETPPAWQSGDRVRLQNGLLTIGGGRTGNNVAI
ncbi:MAG: glycine zipper 2TM domain-containing protein [Burkholderiaceae bacterium]|nr:glycine zipper 2TM domain-containing protein [Sulfuritalea sp.]MCF8174171.1 glycine zipper 2TM domain-containing protein [Burkholderiaceae bacterium]